MGYSPKGHKELDTTERLSTHTYIIIIFVTMTCDQRSLTLLLQKDYNLLGSDDG